MMNVFVDANILVSVLNKEYPLFTYSSRILSLSDSKKFSIYTSSLSLAIAFYFSSKKSGEVLAKKKIALLNQNILLAPISKNAVDEALTNKAVHDLEDGFQYYAAIDAQCECIITENTKDFYFSNIPVLGSERFLEEYML
ncbi:MAG: PIN domain-containing protein [Bacteroidota bacterium]